MTSADLGATFGGSGPCPGWGAPISADHAYSCTSCGAPLVGTDPVTTGATTTGPATTDPAVAAIAVPTLPQPPPATLPPPPSACRPEEPRAPSSAPHPGPGPVGLGAPWGQRYPPPAPGAYPAPYAGPYPAPFQPYPGYYVMPVPAPRTNPLAIASLVLGILWLWWVGSILAVIFGHIALSQMKKRPGSESESGRGIAIAGVVLGWVGVSTAVAFMLLFVVVAVTGHSSSSSG